MPMYWTLNCFLGCIYTVYYIVFLVLNWLSNLEFWLPKKRTELPELESGGGGLGDSGNARKKTFFFHWGLPLLLAKADPRALIRVRRRQIQIHCNWDWICCFEYYVAGTRTHVTHHQFSESLLLWHWYEILALYYVKSILTEISASRQDRRVLQKSKIIRIEFLSKWGMLQTSRYV